MNHFLKYVFVFVLLLTFTRFVFSGILGDAGRPIAGPIDIVLKSFQMCPRRMRGDDGLVFYNITTSHAKGRPYEFFMTSNVSLDFPIDDSLTSELRLSQWTSRGGWKTGMKDIRIPQLCTALNMYAGKIWENSLIQVFGKKIPCPIPPFEHAELRNVSFNSKSIHLREFVYGKWRCDVVITHVPTAATKACIRVVSEIAPAVSEKQGVTT